MKKILIPFSGGLDSTYLVYKNLKEGNFVIPVYIEIIDAVQNKIIIEKQQAKKIAKKLKKRFNKYCETFKK